LALGDFREPTSTIRQKPKTTKKERNNMKSTIKAALCGSLATAIVATILSVLPPRQVAASGQGGVQYKDLMAGGFSQGNALEEELNRLAGEGWRVRTSVMAGLILEK
jgi:hypothetical protein